MKRSLIITALALIWFNASSQTSSIPKTPLSLIVGFYHELAAKPKDMERSLHAGKVFDKYFDKDYVEYGGTGNKRQDFNEFKAFITGTFKKLPNLDVSMEEIIADGDRVLTKIKLSDEKAGVEINYLALYYIKDGKIKNRYAYSDGGF